MKLRRTFKIDRFLYNFSKFIIEMCQDPRAFDNPYLNNFRCINKDKLLKDVKIHQNELINDVLNYGIKASQNDSSVYTGLAGIALMFHKIGHTNQSLKVLEKSLSVSKKSRITFLCGFTGPLAISAKLNHSENDLKEILKVNLQDPNLPNELLYGRVGYLYSLVYVTDTFSGQAKLEIEDKINLTVDLILKEGIKGSKAWKSRCPLMYDWHDKAYYGAAHGLIGIIFILLQLERKFISDETLNSLILPSIDYILGKMFPSGNVPSSMNSETDKLIHWCHGAPGSIHLFLLAYHKTKNPKYFEAAEKNAQVIWSRGLLKKGHGLCHGIAGNGYAFLAMYQATQDPDWLAKAHCFCRFILDQKDPKMADRPFSLFEGISGTIWFLQDILEDPMNAKFPAYYALH